MRVICATPECGSTLNWNHKTDRRKLADFRCPMCGGNYRKTTPRIHSGPASTDVKRELCVIRFERAADRIETALAGMADLAPSLIELGRALQETKAGQLHLLGKGGAA